MSNDVDNISNSTSSSFSSLKSIKNASTLLFSHESKIDALSKNPNLDDETRKKIKAIDDKLNELFSAMLEKVKLSGTGIGELEKDIQDIYTSLDNMEQSKKEQYVQEIE